MKHKIAAYVLTPIMSLGLLGAGVVSAHGFFSPNANPDDVASHQNAMFERKANLLGVSVDEVKDAWSNGKTMQDLAEEKGISADQLREKMKQAAQTEMSAHLKVLVDKGVITQAQADARLKAIESHVGQNKGMFGRHGRPMPF